MWEVRRMEVGKVSGNEGRKSRKIEGSGIRGSEM